MIRKPKARGVGHNSLAFREPLAPSSFRPSRNGLGLGRSLLCWGRVLLCGKPKARRARREANAQAVTALGWRSLFALAFALGGCAMDSSFECESDAPGSGGAFPCPAEERCSDEGQCVSRLDCRRPGVDGCGGGVDPGFVLEEPLSRCEAVIGPNSSGVRCESGVYTATSAVPAKPLACDCAVDPSRPGAERLMCAALADAPNDGRYALYILPDGGPLDAARLGVAEERVDARRCVRPCSSEASCPAGHTCRPAVVVRESAPGAASRHTIAVCYPNRLAATATTASGFEPDAALCVAPSECGGPADGLTCQLQVVVTPDHPVSPIGEAWFERRALLGRCVRRAGLVNPGLGCTLDQPQSCRSGVCFSSRCAALCDPRALDPGCPCRPFQVTRQTLSGAVSDIVHLCSP